MDKRHVWVISMVAFEGQRSDRSGMISVGHELHMPALKVVHLDFSFEGSDENRNDSAQGGCVVDQRHQVRDEPITCMNSQCRRIMQIFIRRWDQIRVCRNASMSSGNSLLPVCSVPMVENNRCIDFSFCSIVLRIFIDVP